MKVLILGEGDFSFSAALAKLPDTASAEFIGRPEISMSDVEITATSLDTEDDVFSIYPEARKNIIKASEKFAVNHGIDALKISTGGWDVLVWNHPHLGVEDARAHRCLLAHFLHCCSKINAQSIVIRLLSGQAERWELEWAAEQHGWFVTEGLKFPGLPGYHVKRNKTARSFISEESRKNWQPENLEMTSLTFCLARENSKLGVFEKYKETSKTAINIICKDCEKFFTTEQGLKTHRRQVHELSKYSEKETECDKCGRQFKSADALSQHGNSCQGGIKRPRTLNISGDWSCEICGGRAASESQHLEIFYQGQAMSRFDCASCGRQFRDERALSQHSKTGRCVEASK